MTTTGFERIVEVSSAFDGRNGSAPEHRRPNMKPDDGTPNTNYGIHGCELRFVLKGPLGATQFVVYTDWQLPHVQEDHTRVPISQLLRERLQPMGTDVGYHSPQPLYEGQSPMGHPCEYLDGRTCYYDGSSLRADDWVRKILLPKGSDGVWDALEHEYRRNFEGAADDEGRP